MTITRKKVAVLTMCVLVLAAVSYASSRGSASLPSDVRPSATCEAGSLLEGSDPLELVGHARGKPPKGDACCDPDLEPGVNGNPLCFEGHTCCSDGVWRCNNPDGSPSCSAGKVCEPGCAGKGESCSSNEDCCSGTCGKNGRCR
ncbi:MAG: hypothetical protein JSV80_03525 [Acidobacteriota bacterium]|nr:MAG: hypothetical protein JSV80_03525 [Acidobacteriota bacterium]